MLKVNYLDYVLPAGIMQPDTFKKSNLYKTSYSKGYCKDNEILEIIWFPLFII